MGFATGSREILRLVYSRSFKISFMLLSLSSPSLQISEAWLSEAGLTEIGLTETGLRETRLSEAGLKQNTIWSREVELLLFILKNQFSQLKPEKLLSQYTNHQNTYWWVENHFLRIPKASSKPWSCFQQPIHLAWIALSSHSFRVRSSPLSRGHWRQSNFICKGQEASSGALDDNPLTPWNKTSSKVFMSAKCLNYKTNVPNSSTFWN